jgi:hypothetical protein
MFGVNDENKVFVSRLMPRVGVPAQIPFRQATQKVKIGIFLNANHLSAYLKVAVWVIRVNNAERNAGITLEIPKLLAGIGLIKTDVGPVPVEPDWCVVWLSLRSNGCYLCQDRCVDQISKFLWNIYHQRLFSFWMGNTTEGQAQWFCPSLMTSAPRRSICSASSKSRWSRMSSASASAISCRARTLSTALAGT